MAIITISTHNGSRVSLAHNNRNPEMVAAENRKWELTHPGELRIDPNGEYEIWKSESLEEAYEKLFGQALEEWNQKQEARGTPDRKINNYLSEIRAKEKQSKNAKKPVYEIIYAVGSKEHPVEASTAKKILREMTEEFEKRNPHLYVICKAFHNDETGVMHVHVSYIPFATDCKRGMKVQNSLSTALQQQGIISTAYSDTAQMAWERKENDTLEEICNRYGYEVSHPQRGTKQEHLSIEEYKLQKEIEEKQMELEKIQALPVGKAVINKSRLEQLEQIEQQYYADKTVIENSKRSMIAAQDAIHVYEKAVQNLDADKENISKKINDAANQKVQLLHADAMKYIAEQGLSVSFKIWQQTVREAQRQQREQQYQ